VIAAKAYQNLELRTDSPRDTGTVLTPKHLPAQEAQSTAADNDLRKIVLAFPARNRRFHTPSGVCCVASDVMSSSEKRARGAVPSRHHWQPISSSVATEMARKGILITVIQRQLGHADLGVTSVYLRGIDNTEIINTVHEGRAPMMPASAGLRIGP
jgi:hypothetical protein